jgi:eukaryotic-like serine/threonine-protein kinase
LSEWAVPGYTELKQLGAGGFGSVVLDRHDATGTAVAIKYLLPQAHQDPDSAAMFRAEAEALGTLDDPHVVRLYEYVESAAGAAIAMELVDGVTLGARPSKPERGNGLVEADRRNLAGVGGLRFG